MASLYLKLHVFKAPPTINAGGGCRPPPDPPQAASPPATDWSLSSHEPQGSHRAENMCIQSKMTQGIICRAPKNPSSSKKRSKRPKTIKKASKFLRDPENRKNLENHKKRNFFFPQPPSRELCRRRAAAAAAVVAAAVAAAAAEGDLAEISIQKRRYV